MKILVTTGTTNFPELINASLNLKEHALILQTPMFNKLPPSGNYEYIPFIHDIDSTIESVDFVITHAGAGNVFKLLEGKKRFIVCPNLFRADNHQKQLADYILKNNYAAVCYDLLKLDKYVNELFQTRFNKYENNHFSGYKLIADMLDI